jgi:hypothetical protein
LALKQDFFAGNFGIFNAPEASKTPNGIVLFYAACGTNQQVKATESPLNPYGNLHHAAIHTTSIIPLNQRDDSEFLNLRQVQVYPSDVMIEPPNRICIF